MPIRSEKERDILIMVDMKAKPFYLSEEDCKWVEETIAGMTTEEKIGQLFFNMGSSRDEEQPSLLITVSIALHIHMLNQITSKKGTRVITTQVPVYPDPFA